MKKLVIGDQDTLDETMCWYNVERFDTVFIRSREKERAVGRNDGVNVQRCITIKSIIDPKKNMTRPKPPPPPNRSTLNW